MKKTLHKSAMLFMLSALGATAGWAQSGDEASKELPYYQNFMFSQEDWTIIDASETPKDTWQYRQIYCPQSGYRNCITMQNDYGGGNDYYISPAFKLEASKKYTVDMSYATFPYSGKMTIELGTDKSDISTFTSFATAEKGSEAKEYESLYDLTVPSDGVYYIAMHATNEGADDNNYVYNYLLDFMLKEAEEGGDQPGDDDTPDVEGTIPYSVTFDSEDNFKTWKTLDNSETKNNTWTWSATDFAGKPAAFIGTDNKSMVCDYFISPAFDLKEGKTYTIKVDCASSESNQTSLIISTTQDRKDANSFNNIDWIGSTLPPTDYETGEPDNTWEFEPTKDGKYYFALQALNWEAGMDTGISIYSVDITENEETVEMASLPYSVDFTKEDNEETDKWVALNRSGQTLDYPWGYSTYGYQEYTIDSSAGYDSWVMVGENHPCIMSNSLWGSDMNIYFASPAFELMAGKTYEITTGTNVNLSCQQDGTTTFELVLGTERKVSSSYSKIATLPLNTVYDKREGKYDFSVPETGTYYIAYRLYNEDGSKPYAYLYDFDLRDKATDGITSVNSEAIGNATAVYTIDGRLASTNADMNNLQKGTYIMTVKAADGTTKSLKVTK